MSKERSHDGDFVDMAAATSDPRAAGHSNRGAFASGNAPQNPQTPAVGKGFEGFEGQIPGQTAPKTFAETTPTRLPGTTDPIPTRALGNILGPLVEDISDALQVPSDLPTNMGLPTVTTAAKGGWLIQVDAGWIEPMALATLTALPSGEKKSPVLAIVEKPLREFEREKKEEEKPKLAEKIALQKLAEGRVDEAKRQAIKGLGDGAKEQEYLDQVKKLGEINDSIKPLPRWMIDDVTPEVVVKLLSEHHALGIVSDEPGLFGVLAGRYSNGAPNIEWFLKATTGSTLNSDRVGRGNDTTENPALSVCSCIQPGRLVELGKVQAFRDSGLLARHLFGIPVSRLGFRGPTRPVHEAILANWHTALSRVAEEGLKRQRTPTMLMLTKEAQAQLEEFRKWMEPHLHPGHGMYAGIADWMNKLCGTIARIAGALTILDDPNSGEITDKTINDAISIGHAYISHAIAAFGMTRPNASVISHARELLAVITRVASPVREFTRREVHQKVRDRRWVENAASLDAPMAVLLDYGHIRKIDDEQGKTGRPRDLYELHPRSAGQNAPQNPQNQEAA